MTLSKAMYRRSRSLVSRRALTNRQTQMGKWMWDDRRAIPHFAAVKLITTCFQLSPRDHLNAFWGAGLRL